MEQDNDFSIERWIIFYKVHRIAVGFLSNLRRKTQLLHVYLHDPLQSNFIVFRHTNKRKKNTNF